MPINIGLILHAHTRKKELVDRINNLGISISYDHVLRLPAEIGNRVCEQFHREQVICPIGIGSKSWLGGAETLCYFTTDSI